MIASSDNTTQPTYAGWIPTANGRLSFRHIGETRYPTPSKYANVATADDRFILAYQRRDLSDSIFRSITDRVCRRSGDFWFAVTAESAAAPDDVEGNVSGTIYIFKSKEDWRAGPEKRVRVAISEMNEARLSLASNRDQTIKSALDWAKKALTQSADVRITFRLMRTGELFVDTPIFRDEDLAFASRAFAVDDGHDFDKWVADQGYFFLRDMSHQHQHHDQAVDTILILQKYGDGDISWRRNIIFSLQFYIISSRRSHNLKALVQTTGVLAYFESFLGICRRKLGDAFTDIPSFEIEALKSSLAASIDEQNSVIQQEAYRSAQITNFRVMTLSVLAPTLALIGVALQPHIGGDANRKDFPTLNEAARFISYYAMEICGFVVLALVLSWTINSTLISFKKSQHSRELLSLGVANELWAAGLAFFAAILFAAFGAYFGWTTVTGLYEVIAKLFHR